MRCTYFLLILLGVLYLAPSLDAVISSSKPGAKRHSASAISNKISASSLSSTTAKVTEATSSPSLFNVNTMMFVFYTTVGATLPYLPMYYKHIDLTGNVTCLYVYIYFIYFIYIVYNFYNFYIIF